MHAQAGLQLVSRVSFGQSADISTCTTCNRQVDMQKCVYPNDGKQDLQMGMCVQKFLHGTAKRWHACRDSNQTFLGLFDMVLLCQDELIPLYVILRR